MIKVNIYENSTGKPIGLKLKGHAGYDIFGKDIICAAASILTINTINSIESFTHDKLDVTVDEKNALIDFKLDGNISVESQVLLDALKLGLMNIENQGSDYISIRIKEV